MVFPPDFAYSSYQQLMGSREVGLKTGNYTCIPGTLRLPDSRSVTTLSNNCRYTSLIPEPSGSPKLLSSKATSNVFAATCTKIRHRHMPITLKINFSKKNVKRYYKDHELRKCKCSLLNMEAEQLFLQPILIKCGFISQVV